MLVLAPYGNSAIIEVKRTRDRLAQSRFTNIDICTNDESM